MTNEGIKKKQRQVVRQFPRIYFTRGNDINDDQKERKKEDVSRHFRQWQPLEPVFFPK